MASGSRPVPYDQRLARRMVVPLARTGLRPNHLTAATLALSLAAAALFALGTPQAAHWAAALFVVSRLLDHFDGELARLTGQKSRFGYYFDYLAGGLGYAALFAGIGIGLGSDWALTLGILGATAALVSLLLNLQLDRALELKDGAAVGYPAFGGLELEDGIYLIAPITWLGWLTPFFAAAAIGAVIYALYTAGRLVIAVKA